MTALERGSVRAEIIGDLGTALACFGPLLFIAWVLGPLPLSSIALYAFAWNLVAMLVRVATTSLVGRRFHRDER